ncbi:copper chaperone PCu(A)C [Psychromarinibacter sp. C21-152]|uniref:Copper chaperone PCu(A)C n=1 Tax=Psychromarinibacter sediminicola TaxID=3033385 RepID=A0AAE3NRM1_9RHOB|nr:copper chaperone PCu(A)C [Psychromarinibacter sediminicola]MDF0599252.1 copper chaperone PCu(A)C [Psychromarinibacter sediminicola]
MRRLPLALATLACLSLPAAAQENHDNHDDQDDHLAEADGVRILHAWAVPEDGAVRIYMEIENTGDRTLTLTGGETHDGAALALMATELQAEGGAVPLGEFPIKAGTEIDLDPGGLYLVLNPASDLAEGDRFAAHVDLEPLGEVEIEVDVLAPGTRQHPHAGHRH